MTQELFSTLAKRHMDAVFRLAFSMVKNKADADDITQNVLLSLYRTDKAFESDAHIKNWLMRVTVNECRKLWRSPWNSSEDFDDYSETLTFDAPEYSELYEAIMNLDRKYRAVIVLYYCEGYSIKEIADILHIPAATAGTRLSRAREQLKKYLTEADDND